MANYITRANAEWFQKHVEPDDVIIASYPKSGTNWIKQIVHVIRLRGDPERVKAYEDTDLSVLINIPDAIKDFDFQAVSELRPRAFFGHAQFEDTPKGAKCIYVVRDMPDVVKSFHDYVGKFGDNLKGYTVDDTAQLMMDGLLYCGSWETHVSGWWQHRNDPNVLFVTFESMKKDLPREIERISKFMGFDLTPEELKGVYDMSTLAYMKARSDKIQGKEWAASVTGQKIADDYTLVKDGTSGKKGFQPDIVEAMKHHFQEKAAPLLDNAQTYADFVTMADSGRDGKAQPDIAIEEYCL